ncbi:MAG: hypothetical protein N2738_02865, partial [Thermodesulfovibrionales bacterium]|nr:hypothetical protein [Thermodesulfovibrionales bacterium]
MKNKVLTKPLVFFLIALVFVIALTIFELRHLKTVSVDFSTKILLVGLLTFNAVAIATLVFFTVRNLYKLYYEKRGNIPGHRFKTKLALIFTIFSLIPSVLLFVVASGLATNFIDNIFSPYIGEHMNLSIETARETYDLIRKHVLTIAEETSKGGQVNKLPNVNIYRIKNQEGTSDIIKEAFNGKKGTEIISTKDGDLIRAAVPSGRDVTIAEIIVPNSLASKVDKLRDFNEEYFK